MTLSSRSPDFFDLFASQAAIASQGARELREMLLAAERAAEGAAKLYALRDDGKLIAGWCLDELRLTFATPIDRDAIVRLTKNLHRALAMIEEAAARVDLYRLEVALPEAESLAELLLGALAATEQALSSLRRPRGADGVLAACDRVAGLTEEADRIARRARARLFREELDPRVIIKWGDVLEHLAAAAVQCRDAARVIEQIAVEALS